jgi:DNA repair protein SbcD/Mre11
MECVRFIHTSDIHLDTSFSASGFPPSIGHRKREAIRSTLRKILDDAIDLRVDLVLIAGDLFEHDRVTPDTVEFLKQQFSRVGHARIFIAPGNHDPFIQGSPYREESWPANVHIFREEKFQSIELPGLGVRITGFAFNRTQVPDPLFRDLAPLPEGLFNLVLAHGSNAGNVPQGKIRHAPFAASDLAGKNVGYCALGHYHLQQRIDCDGDPAAIWYSGIPEGRSWGEEGKCSYLIGSIENGGLTVESRACSQYPLHTITVSCDEFFTREQLLDAIRQVAAPVLSPETILRIRLEGSPDPGFDPSPGELSERLAGSALYIQWEDDTQPALDFESLGRESTLCGRFVQTMNERIVAADPGDAHDLKLARLYGTQALLGREVRLR